MSKSGHGGARQGAGRPKSEQTVMVRVPEGCLADVRALIEKYKLKKGVRGKPPC